jgi:hypothetical protein
MKRKIAKKEYLMKPVDWRLVGALIVLALAVIVVFNITKSTPSVKTESCYSSSDCPAGLNCYIGIKQNTCIDPKCWEYCNKQPHIMCVGEWNITGVYPDCVCQWLCEEGGPV